jgi:DNA (cytosine-5)-methyltransferase 1
MEPILYMRPVAEKVTPLRSILEPEDRVAPEFYIPKSQLKAWRELKGGKKETRTAKSGFTYEYSEGPVAFPDHLDKPSRTIVTGEGGSTPSRFKHVVEIVPGKPRRLMPVELERLNMFDPGHTEGVSDTTRAFFMGNALVVGIVTRLGKELARRIDG